MRCRACLLLLALPRAGSLAQRADRAAVVLDAGKQTLTFLDGGGAKLPFSRALALDRVARVELALTAPPGKRGAGGAKGYAGIVNRMDDDDDDMTEVA